MAPILASADFLLGGFLGCYRGPRGELLKEVARALYLADTGEVASPEEVDQPVGKDSSLPLPHGDSEAVVEPVSEPGEQTGEGKVTTLEHSVTNTYTCDSAQVLVDVIIGFFATD